VTTVGQRVGVRVGVRVGMRASAPVVSPVVTHALDLDGLTRWGWGEWAEPPEQAGGMSLVVELADGTGTAGREVMLVAAPSGDVSMLRMSASALGATRLRGGIETSSAVTSSSTTALTPDSAGYLIASAQHENTSGTDSRAVARTLAIATAASTTTIAATRDVRNTKSLLIIGSSTTAGASLFTGKIARWAVFPGLLSAAEMVLLYQDATAWEAAIPDRLPHGVWYAQDGVDATTTLVVPARYKGPDGLAPDVTFVATNRSDLSATVPTRTA
jgi:hypothetical protein